MRSALEDFFHGLLSDSVYAHSDWEKHHLTNRDWRAFEELIAVLWSDMGYNTSLQQGKRDGGIDVIADETNLIPFSNPPTIAIQVKQWDSKITVSKIRELYGVQNSGHPQASVDAFDESILVTSLGCTGEESGFTQGARQFAEKSGVELIDGESLLNLLNESNLSPLRLGRKPGQKWHLRESPCCGWSQKFNQNQAYAQTAEKVFNAKTQQIASTDDYTPMAMENLCEACMNLRLE